MAQKGRVIEPGQHCLNETSQTKKKTKGGGFEREIGQRKKEGANAYDLGPANISSNMERLVRKTESQEVEEG